MDATPEEWRSVVGHEGAYEISSHGRVRSLDRIITFPNSGKTRLARGRILKPWTMKRIGHQCVGLTQKRRALVHVLVLEAFVGPRPDNLVCCHNDGDPANNHVENLRWDTYAENNQDLVRHGTHWQVRKTHCPQGHEYDSVNTYIIPSTGGRVCRICQVEHSRDWKRRHRKGRAQQSHCKRGHEYTPENTYVQPRTGHRRCRQCMKINYADWRSENRRK